ncbi:MAG: PQQ-dependent dehydrogenase, methanol/ethanol family [Vicinamibacterales bacterium]
MKRAYSSVGSVAQSLRLVFAAVVVCAWSGVAGAQTMDELIGDAKTPGDVLTHSLGFDRKNYSPLDQINPSNVKRLVPVWSTSLMNDYGELGTPTVYDGVMYVVNGRWTFALDVATGRQLWRTIVDFDPAVSRVATFGPINRGGATIYNGKLYRITIDNHILALDMKTGKVLWDQKFADFKEGYTATGAPIVANNVVISGMAGGEFTTRGFLDGWDPETGQKLWRTYTVPAPGEPGSETWPKGSDAWKWGGGATWRSGTYDPELDLVYWGTGNAEPYNPKPRGHLDSLYTSSVIAIKPKTGQIACFYQYTPNDVYDVDGVDELVLADVTVQGQPRKVMMQANKNGFLYVIDRTNCKLIAAHPYVQVNWAKEIDLKTGRPVLTDLYEKFLSGDEVQIYPQRGTNAVPIAYNPRTGLVYASTWNVPRIQKLAPEKPQVIGTNSTGVLGRQPVLKPGDIAGHFVAINPLTGEKKWEVPLPDMPSSAGMMVTGGGLVFTGKPTGELVALDEATGRTLWQFKTSSSVNASAITYLHNGKQYVTVLSGLGGGLAKRYAATKVPAGGSVWTFALMD